MNNNEKAASVSNILLTEFMDYLFKKNINLFKGKKRLSQNELNELKESFIREYS